MATIDDVIIKGRAYRVFDEVNEIWKRMSYWTAASDVYFEDGKNAEDVIEDLTESMEQSIEEVNETLSSKSDDLSETIDNLSQNINSNYIKKNQLTFTLSGNDLYITKNY